MIDALLIIVLVTVDPTVIQLSPRPRTSYTRPWKRRGQRRRLTVGLRAPDGVAQAQTSGHDVEHRRVVGTGPPPGQRSIHQASSPPTRPAVHSPGTQFTKYLTIYRQIIVRLS